MAQREEPAETRVVAVLEVVKAMRRHFGMTTDELALRRNLPDGVLADLVAPLEPWVIVAWCALGVRLLSGGVRLRVVAKEARLLAATAAMRCHKGNRVRAAKVLGLTRWELSRRLPVYRSVPVGERVVAIESASSTVVYVYGRGVFTGKARPPNGTVTRFGVVGPRWPANFKVPAIRLDDGTVVWGPQCSAWMTDLEFAAEHGEREVVVVPPP